MSFLEGRVVRLGYSADVYKTKTLDRVIDKLHTGDLVLLHGQEGTSRVIQVASRSFWSHCAIIIRGPLSDAVKQAHEIDDTWQQWLHYYKTRKGTASGCEGEEEDPRGESGDLYVEEGPDRPKKKKQTKKNKKRKKERKERMVKEGERTTIEEEREEREDVDVEYGDGDGVKSGEEGGIPRPPEGESEEGRKQYVKKRKHKKKKRKESKEETE